MFLISAGKLFHSFGAEVSKEEKEGKEVSNGWITIRNVTRELAYFLI